MRPTILTHYSRGEPFASITAAPHLIPTLTEATTWGLARFADPDYLPRRLAVEARLRAAFIAAGGQPHFDHPAYAFLGRNPRWDQQLRPGMRAYLITLDQVPSTALSFTVGDSLLTWDPIYAQLRPQHPLAGRLFRLEDLPDVAPADLEAQLWQRPPDSSLTIENLPPR
jgi:hypothetical protein